MVKTSELSQQDRFVRARNRTLLGSAATFSLWQLGQLAAGGVAGPVHDWLKALSLVGAVAWVALTAFSVFQMRAMRKDRHLKDALQDERASNVQLRAYRFSFWVMIVFGALLGAPAEIHLVTGRAVSTLVTVTGIATFLVTFVVLDGE